MTKTNYAHQIAVLKGALGGYLKTSDYLYNSLRANFVNRENSNSLRGVLENPGELSPLVTNIAFSLELALKILRIQDNPEKAPRGHDLHNLWKALSNDFKEPAENKYAELLASWDENDPMKYVAFAKHAVPEPKSGLTLNKALQNIKNAFVEWRYMYENFGTSNTLIFNFVEANCAIQAISHASVTFKGGVVVEGTWNYKT